MLTPVNDRYLQYLNTPLQYSRPLSQCYAAQTYYQQSIPLQYSQRYCQLQIFQENQQHYHVRYHYPAPITQYPYRYHYQHHYQPQMVQQYSIPQNQTNINNGFFLNHHLTINNNKPSVSQVSFNPDFALYPIFDPNNRSRVVNYEIRYEPERIRKNIQQIHRGEIKAEPAIGLEQYLLSQTSRLLNRKGSTGKDPSGDTKPSCARKLGYGDVNNSIMEGG